MLPPTTSTFSARLLFDVMSPQLALSAMFPCAERALWPPVK